MKLKYKVFTLLFLISFFVLGSSNIIYAQTSSPSGTRTPGLSVEQNIKDKASSEIIRRITSLNNLITRIQEMKKISDSSKSNFVVQAQDEITSLNTLSVKINADTDLAILNQDRKSIANQYRIYLLFIPKIQILAVADRLLEFADNASLIVAKLQTRINQDSQKGKDVKAMQTALVDMQTRIADIKAQVTEAQNLVMPLAPDAGNSVTAAANKQSLQDARSRLVIARKDVAAVLQDGASIIAGLKPSATLKPSTPSATRTATRSASQ